MEKSTAGTNKRSPHGLSHPNRNTIIINIIIIIIIIYHDFLPTPRRGSHVKSGKTHTVIKIHPLAHFIRNGKRTMKFN